MLKSGTSDLLKEGTTHLSGVEEAILKNIEAVKEFSQITRTSLGPNGQKKILINHLNKLFCSSDSGTIMRELDVEHPAAKLVSLASKMQESEVGDGSNFIVVLCGELLYKAEGLIMKGLHPPEIISGFRKAGLKALEILDELVMGKVENVCSEKEVETVIRSVLTAKQPGFEDTLAPLVAEACVRVMPKNPKFFNVDNIRVAKSLGGGIHDSRLIPGMVLQRNSENAVMQAVDAKCAVFSCAIDSAKTETKGTVLIENAEQLKNYSFGEENLIEQALKGLADAGVKVIFTGSTISDIALHFLSRYKIMPIKVLSKFELRRVCKLVGATPQIKLTIPKEQEFGHCDFVGVEEVGSDIVTVLKQNSAESRISTIFVRGSTMNLLDDVERAIDDAVNNVRQMTQDGRLLGGAGATEIELARRLSKFADQTPGLDQYGIAKFSEALEVIPRTLADNAGYESMETISNLYAAHENGDIYMGVNIEDEGKLLDTKEAKVFDLLSIKANALKLVVETITTVLKVDQIIMARTAGGPKPRGMGARDAD